MASRELEETERFMSNRMKNRAVGLACVISLYLPDFRCVSASILFYFISLYLTISSFHTGTIAIFNLLKYPEDIFFPTDKFNHMVIHGFPHLQLLAH